MGTDFSAAAKEIVQGYFWVFYSVGIVIVLFGALFRLPEIRDIFGAAKLVLILAVTIFFMFSFPAIFKGALNGFRNAKDDNAKRIEQFIEDISNPQVKGENSLTNLTAGVTKVFYQLLVSWGAMIKFCMMFLQAKICQVMMIISPLCIAMFVVPHFKSAGIKFVQTAIAMCVWLIALDLADIFVVELLDLAFKKMSIDGSSGGGFFAVAGAVGSAAMAPAVLFKIGAVFLSAVTFIYVFVPLLAVKFIMGESMSSALTAATMMTGQMMSAGGGALASAMKVAGSPNTKLTAGALGGTVKNMIGRMGGKSGDGDSGDDTGNGTGKTGGGGKFLKTFANNWAQAMKDISRDIQKK